MTLQSNLPNPFKGLRPYEEADQEKLFGRDRDLILMKDRILSGRTTLLFAGSGVGKTSFLSAKIVPEMKKQYCVIWHNRWTGADVPAEPDDAKDHQVMRFWPPRALRRSLIYALGFRTRREEPKPERRPDKKEEAEDKLSSEIRQIIAQSLRSSPDPKRRLSEGLAVFKKSSETANDSAVDAAGQKPEKERCVLILDQFEEVFQYHAFEPYFASFVDDLCKIINDDHYQVRVIFSMREEFLGELSIFDNSIPDLFNNYYRLRYPDKDEAADIIRRTTALVKFAPDREKPTSQVTMTTDDKKLGSLVDDLSKFEKAGSNLSQADGKMVTQNRVIERNFVAPPYLQIACERLWNGQYSEAPKVVETSPGSSVVAESKISFSPFLTNYQSGGDEPSDEPGEEPGGEAQRALRTFCEEKLSAPFLSSHEQDLAARAFGFLVTKQGAKMAVELSSLASHMDESLGPLKTTLEKLSQPEARILRESRGPERSYWFELYHDMYAGIVEKWKHRYDKEKMRRNSRKMAAGVAVPLGIILITYSVFHWYVYPSRQIRTLVEYKNSLNSPWLRNDQEGMYSRSLLAYAGLKETFGYGNRADTLLGEIFHRRAQLAEREERRDYALLFLLQAAALEHDSCLAQQYLQEAGLLAGEDYSDLLATYCDNCRGGKVSRDGRLMLTISRPATVKLWELESGGEAATLCDDCTQAVFSSDAKVVVMSRPIYTEDTKAPKADTNQDSSNNAESNPDSKGASPPDSNAQSGDGSARRQRLLTGWEVRLWDTTTRRDVGPLLIFQPEPVRSNKQQKDETKKSSDAPEGEVDSPAGAFRVITAANSKSGFLFAGTLNGRIRIWRSDGKPFGEPLSLEEGAKPLTTTQANSLNLTFSPDGSHLAAGAFVGPNARLWKISATGAVLDARLKDLTRRRMYAFSGDSKFFLTATDHHAVELWNLETDQLAKRIEDVDPGRVSSVGFSKDSSAFFIGLSKGDSRVWNIDTGELRFQPLQFSSGGIRFAGDAKTLLRTVSSPRRLEKWDLASGNKIGELELGSSFAFPLYSDGQSVVISSGSNVRRWSIPPVRSHGELLPIAPPSFALSEDGKTIVGMSNDGMVELWNLETSKPVGQPLGSVKSLSPDEFLGSDFILSRDGLQVALSNEHEVTVWSAQTSWSPVSLHYDDEVSALSFSPDGKFLAVGTPKAIYLLGAPSYTQLARLESDSPFGNLKFSPDGKYLCKLGLGAAFFTSTPDELVKIWVLPEGRKISKEFPGDVDDAVFSYDGKVLVSAGNHFRVSLWDLIREQKLGEIQLESSLSAVAFSPDSKWAIAGDEEGGLQLWRIGSVDSLSQKVKLGSQAEEIIFSPDGATVMVATSSWIHRLALSENRLMYLSGMLTEGAVQGTRRLIGENEQSVRFLRSRNQGLGVINQRFNGVGSKDVFSGGRQELLYEWQKKLAVRIDSVPRDAGNP